RPPNPPEGVGPLERPPARVSESPSQSLRSRPPLHFFPKARFVPPWIDRKIRAQPASALSRLRPGLLQELVHEGDGHAALADRDGDPLHRAAADVAASEDAGDAGLEEVRVATLSPAAGLHHGVSGEQIAALVPCKLRREPGGLGVRPDEDEDAS